MSLRPAARAWLFDLDGTLVDTAPDLGHAANHVRGQCGLPPLPLADYRSSSSAGARGLLRIALGLRPEDADFPARRESFLAHYREHLSAHADCFVGIETFLGALEQRHLPWGVVTNKPGWLTQPLMQDLGLAARAACIVSGDSTPRPKPAPDPLLLACRQLGLEPADCVYVGDDLRDIQAAHAAGMRAIAAGWGYEGATPLAEWQADVVAPTPADLLALLD